jgi:ketosteroid isomerase-like protein
MRSSSLKPIDVLTAFLEAYEARDIDRIERMLTEDVRLQDWNLVAQGKNAVLTETRKNFLDAQHLEIEVRELYEGTGCAAARLRIVVNRSIELEVVDTIVVTVEGKISSIRAYKG